MRNTKVWKNPLNPLEKFRNREALVLHIDCNYKEQIKEFGVTPSQLVFNFYNNYPLNKKFGSSVISKKPTIWNEEANRYERFSDDKEKELYRTQFVERMKKKYNVSHLLNSPEQQKKMLANRKISGEYIFKSDGEKKTYTGSYEHDFLHFMDMELNWLGKDISAPAPQTFFYSLPGELNKRFWIPDFWIESLNLIIEIKGTNPHYQLRETAVENTKDILIKDLPFRYLKIVDKNYSELIDLINILRNE